MKSHIVELAGVTKSYGPMNAVDDVSFVVKKGEVVGFVGANGAGKTTTISLMLGFVGANKGTVSLFGSPITPQKAAKSHKRIGFASGDMELPPQLTGEQYLTFLMAQYPGATSRLEELSGRFSPQLHKKIATLSRGNKQKIALIAAFLPEPELVILDEPTSGLDPIMQEAFLSLIHEEQTKGTTVFMSSHYLGEVADVCSRIILMKEGKVAEDIDASTLLTESGKQIRIVSGYAGTMAPKGASSVTKSKNKKSQVVIEFTWKSEPHELQHWLAGVKQLVDIEVTEYNLEGAFRELYEPKEVQS
jgi:ABC-2 type transport system ATP-binding protein